MSRVRPVHSRCRLRRVAESRACAGAQRHLSRRCRYRRRAEHQALRFLRHADGTAQRLVVHTEARNRARLGTVATSADGLTATFSPSSNVAAATVYTATITTGASSAAGASFAADQSWSFTTGAAADTTAPVVAAPDPASAASGVPINATISASFSKDMDPLTITSSSFTVKQGAAQVPGDVTYGPGTTATFTPAASLAPSTLFTATISADVKDLAGNALAAFSWSFTTGTAAVPVQVPTVTSTFPVNAATAVALNAKLSASFDLRMFPLSTANFTLKQGTTQVGGKVATSANGLTATFAPSSSLSANAVYTATI